MAAVKIATITRAALLALMLAACSEKPAPPSAFEGFVSDATRELLQDAPELATQAGLSPAQVGQSFSTQLNDRSALAIDLRRGMALRLYAQLRALDRDAISPAQRTTFDILSAKFAAAADGARFTYGRFSELGGFSPYILNQIDSAFVTLPSFFEHDVQVASLTDADLYVRRLEGVAGALDDEVERARADARAGVIAPDVVIDRAAGIAAGFLAAVPADLPYVRGLRTKLEAIVGALPADPAADTPDQARARTLLRRAETIAVTQIVPAYRRTAVALAEARARASAEPGVSRLPEGDAYYRAALKAATSTSLSPDEIHELGLKRVRQIAGEMDMMLRSQGLTDGSVGQRMAQITADPRFAYPATPEGRAAALNDVNTRLRAVEAKLGGAFRSLSKVPLEAHAAPDYAAGSFAGGYYQTPPLAGDRPGGLIINVDPRGGLTKVDLPTLVFHEGEPGHHLQVTRALARTDLPLLRRLTRFNAFSEGWAVYAEQLADEMGLYDGDPYGRLGYLRWKMWRVARLVVDTGIHAKHWTREQAVAYLQDLTGDSPSVIELEVERYAAQPGQACGYELGRDEIVALRDRARAALGERFDLREFHEAILGEGELPPAVLEARVNAWLASAAGGNGQAR